MLMAQPAQIKTGLPSGEFIVIDNASAPTFPVLSAGTHIGYDTMTGAVGQGLNSFGDTGTVLLDKSGNDTASTNPRCSTFAGNPVSMTAPTFKVVTKVLQDSRQGIDVAWKNPA